VGLVGSDAAERNDIFKFRIFYAGGDGVADPIVVSQRIVAGEVGWNHHVGGVCLLQGLGEGGRVSDVADKCFRTLRREGLKMSCVSTDDTNFLLAGKKSLGYHVSSVAACTKNDVHVGLHVWVRCGRVEEELRGASRRD